MNEYFASRRRSIDEHLATIAAASVAPAVLRPVLDQVFRSPGKRVRGTLVLAAAETFGMRADKVLDAASAFEMIHTSSLILDDLPPLDDARLRRGVPTVHLQFGEDLAILAAVGLLNHAYGTLGRNHAAVRPRRWPLAKILERVVTAVGWDGSVGGEAVDLHSEAENLDFGTLEYIHSRKTGALFVACAAVGGMLANARPDAIGALEAYAKNLGLAFQITDDILDVTATEGEVGKDVGKDTGKLTFVRLAGVEGAQKLTTELIDTSISAISRMGSGAQPLRDLAIMVLNRV